MKAGQPLAIVHKVCQVFEAETSSLAQSSDVHNLPSIDEDFQLVLQVIMDENVLQNVLLFKSGLMQSYKEKELIKKIQTTINGLLIV